jgi:hypothetical protein
LVSSALSALAWRCSSSDHYDEHIEILTPVHTFGVPY